MNVQLSYGKNKYNIHTVTVKTGAVMTGRKLEVWALNDSG